MTIKGKFLAALCMSCIGSQVAASDLREAANCAATFRVLNSIGYADEALGEYFTAQAMISFDMVGFYGKEEMGSITNGQTGGLVNQAQRSIDSESTDGEGFKPYVASCMGWTFRLVPYISEATGGDTNPSQSVLRSAPRPSSQYSYPFEDWASMEGIFEAAYYIWTDMGKPTPEDLKNDIYENLE